jgi:hypothetical protein
MRIRHGRVTATGRREHDWRERIIEVAVQASAHKVLWFKVDYDSRQLLRWDSLCRKGRIENDGTIGHLAFYQDHLVLTGTHPDRGAFLTLASIPDNEHCYLE